MLTDLNAGMITVADVGMYDFSYGLCIRNLFNHLLYKNLILSCTTHGFRAFRFCPAESLSMFRTLIYTSRRFSRFVFTGKLYDVIASGLFVLKSFAVVKLIEAHYRQLVRIAQKHRKM